MLVGGIEDFVFAGEEIKNGIDKKILDELTAKAKENPRLRCNDMVPGGVDIEKASGIA